MTRSHIIRTVLAALGVSAAVAAGVLFTGGAKTGADGPAAPAPMALPVDVVTVQAKLLRLWVTYPARLQAVEAAEIRPQVSGEITAVRFKDGARVAKGDVLFVIDPRPYEAAAAAANAEVAAARQRHAYAAKELKRARSLIKTHAVSKQVLDERANAFRVAQSEIDAAKARLKGAELDLDHAFVKAPIAGRLSRAEITVGNLVNAGSAAPLLTSIVSDASVYADFDVDEKTYLDFVRSGARGLDAERKIPVRLAVEGGTAPEIEGFIHTFDNRIDPRTGTIRARALFPNPSGALLPGMFVEVKLGSPTERETVLLTERAILTDQDRKFVYLMDKSGKAVYREVTVGAQVKDQRVIASGLKAGDRVITSNLLLLRPNAPVTPKGAGPAPAKGKARAAGGQDG